MKDFINSILLPFKLIIPQPVIEKLPGLTTNKQIRIRNVIQEIIPSMHLLDIGCGGNLLVRTHKKNGGSGLGVDVFPWEGVDKVIKDSSDLPFPEKQFDCVTFIACLNHIPNRLEVLKETSRVLKDDGIVIITFLPKFISAVWHKICFWDKDQRHRGMVKGEVYGFNDIQVCSLFEQADFKVVKKKTFSFSLNKLYVFSKA